MAFTYTVEIEGVDVTNSVLDGFSITNGRTTLLEPLGQFSASFSVFREFFYAIFATAAVDPKVAGLGAYVVIFGADNTEIYFAGHITDMSSDADVIRFSLVDKNIFKLTAAPAITTDNSTSTSNGYLTVLTSASIPGSSISVAAVPLDSTVSINNGLQLTAKEISNRAQEIRDVIGSNETAFGWFIAGDGLYVRDRLVNPTSADATLTDDEVVKNYSLSRSIADILNDATVSYYDTSTTTTDFRAFNATSIEDIGVRNNSRTTMVYEEANANRVAKAILASGAPGGWPIVKCRTNSLVMSYTSAQMLDKFMPNNVLDCSAVTAEGFDTYMYIEQVSFTLSRDIIEADLLLSSSQYSTLPQVWEDTPGFNKVINGDFKTNITGWEAATASTTVAWSSAGRRNGALETTAGTSGSVLGARIDNTATYRIPVVPGQTFEVNGYVRNTVGTRTLRLYARFYVNATTTTVLSVSGSSTTNSTSWTKLTSTGTVPATATHADVYAEMTNTGSIGDKFLLDDVNFAINGVTWASVGNVNPNWDDLLYTRL